MTEEPPPPPLDYAGPRRDWSSLPPLPPRSPVASRVLLYTGAGLSVPNCAGVVDAPGDFFFGPLLSVLSLSLFGAGMIAGFVAWRLRLPRAGVLTLLNAAGIVLSVVLGCAGLPRR